MAFNSFISTLDTAFKLLLYNRFGSILNLNTTSSTDSENINQGVIQFPKDVALRMITEKRGYDRLEFISFWRVRTSPDWDRQRTPLARRGLYLATTGGAAGEGTDSVHVKAFAAKFEYDVHFWSSSLDKINELLEKYLFWQHEDPNLRMKYDDAYDFEPDLHFGNIVDESPVEDILDKGKLFIYKVPVMIDTWILSGFSIKTIKKIVLTFYDKDSLEEDDFDTIIVDDSNLDTELEVALRFFRKEYE